MKIKARAVARFSHIKAAIRPSNYKFSELLITSGNFFERIPDVFVERQIAYAMRSEGSDKCTSHDYERIYSFLIANVPRGPILEIGLGSNNLDTPSNMGSQGIPGASLRAWRSLGFFSEVWGADVDKRILFTEPGIETRFVDQLDVTTIEALAKDANVVHPCGFALIVDDGLHTAEANFNVICGLWGSLMVGGYLIVEDLSPEELHKLMLNIIGNFPDADWALWSNINRGVDNQVLVLKRVSELS